MFILFIEKENKKKGVRERGERKDFIFKDLGLIVEKAKSQIYIHDYFIYRFYTY